MDSLRTVTSYFDKGWNACVQQKDGSIQWIPEQIVGIGEDFHIQVDDGKVKTTRVCVFYCHSNLVWTNLVGHAT